MSDRTYLEAWQQAHREAGADMDRVICERDEARAERDALAAQLADRDAEVVSLQETCEELHAEAKAWEREAAALAAQLEAARHAAEKLAVIRQVERLEAKVEEFHRWGSDSPDEIADHLESIGLGENARTIRRLTSIAEAAAEYVETQTVCETCASLRRLRWLLEEMP